MGMGMVFNVPDKRIDYLDCAHGCVCAVCKNQFCIGCTGIHRPFIGKQGSIICNACAVLTGETIPELDINAPAWLTPDKPYYAEMMEAIEHNIDLFTEKGEKV